MLPKIEIEILCVKKILNHCEHLLTCDLNEWLTLGITNSGQRRVDYFRSNLEYVHGMGICWQVINLSGARSAPLAQNRNWPRDGILISAKIIRRRRNTWSASTNLYWSRLKLGSPLLLITGITDTGFEIDFIDLLRFTGRAGFSPTCILRSFVSKYQRWWLLIIPAIAHLTLTLQPAWAACSPSCPTASTCSGCCLWSSPGIGYQNFRSAKKCSRYAEELRECHTWA